MLRLDVIAVAVLLTASLIYCEDENEVHGLIGVKEDGSLFSTDELITKFGFKSEKHEVITADGYKLTIFRVLPSKQPAVPVLLQHGFMASSDCWVTDNSSLALTLSNEGYDVFIPNIRGNAYARAHQKLSPQEKEFWDFSWHEMGTKDMPACVDYILETTKQTSLHYIGHSMGTTLSYVLLSTLPEYNTKIKSNINLSPVVYLTKANEMVGPDGMVEEMAATKVKEYEDQGKCEVFPRSDVPFDNKTQITCSNVEEEFMDMCQSKMEELHNVIGGPYMPAGFSFKTLLHWYQMGKFGEMRYFDFGSNETNKEKYDSESPPSYIDKFNLITVPTFMWSAERDQVVLPEDVDKLKEKVTSLKADNRVKEECFEHMAFVFPMTRDCLPVREKVYKGIIEAIKKFD